MRIEVLRGTYHSPITIRGLTYDAVPVHGHEAFQRPAGEHDLNLRRRVDHAGTLGLKLLGTATAGPKATSAAS